MATISAWLNKAKSRWPFSLLHRALPRRTRAGFRRTLDRITAPGHVARLERQVSQLNDLTARLSVIAARETPRAREPKRLLAHGFKAYSQHDEDGIIEEIFRRVGTTTRYFVEFGVGDGMENCTTYLLLQGWRGAWIDGSAACYEAIGRHLGFAIADGRLRALHSFITAENIESLFASLGVPSEFDLLSIDIDRNDFWVWRAIEAYRPRVVVIEYNASFREAASLVVPYAASAIWDGSNYFGASLKALERLGDAKGYRLVGCNLTGVSAFFVRDDLVADRFLPPYTSENHYEPPAYFLRMPNGHPPGVGPLVTWTGSVELDAPSAG
jgi:hypothetical protein